MTVEELINELEEIEDKSAEVIIVMNDIYNRLHYDAVKMVSRSSEVWICNYTYDTD